MPSDSEIRHNVEAELRWDPDIDPTDIGVSVKDGVVTLTGFVHSYGQRRQAEIDAKRVAGVKGVANDIQVRLPLLNRRPDPEIAREIVAELQEELPSAADHIKVSVEDGTVTLEGDVEWYFQKERAEEVVRRVRGVKSVDNSIRLTPRIAPSEIKEKIEEALRRNARLAAEEITVETDGSSVTLRGTVRSWAQREEAERAAWAAPGVTNVRDEIEVIP
jgi:osmotically-inducible protein OsmY